MLGIVDSFIPTCISKMGLVDLSLIDMELHTPEFKVGWLVVLGLTAL